MGYAWRRIVDTGGRVRIDDLAREAGLSRQHLTRRFRVELGLTPKQAARVVRFDRSRRLLRDLERSRRQGSESGQLGLAGVAAWPEGGTVALHSAPREGRAVGDLAGADAGASGYPPFGVHLDTDQPDARYARAVAAGATVVRELRDSPYGTRGFIVRDPEGLYWSVGTPLPELVRDSDGRWRPAAGSGG